MEDKKFSKQEQQEVLLDSLSSLKALSSKYDDKYCFYDDRGDNLNAQKWLEKKYIIDVMIDFIEHFTLDTQP